ncbi:hypothetical protein Mgra_00002345 [Meloidogyne graminicola]|uniref:Uncharacterized protein n=1 Tax=Meloidogyne graminicola TaxID=189291 RepID=A0A8S9ZWX0_9BILA|nr:hypothetical protein Mgra_00002345 [Meloidogyne graminicola]
MVGKRKHPTNQQQQQQPSQQKQSSSSFVFKRQQVQQQIPFDKNKKILIIPSQSIIAENGKEEEEISVAETIVLPSKNTSDRLDFTRNWLTSGGSDMVGWAEGRGGEGERGEEYSSILKVGNKKKQQQQLILIKNQQQQKQQLKQIIPLRQKQPPPLINSTTKNVVPPPQISISATIPSAFRPQPVKPQLGILPANLTVSGQMHKVPSIEQIRFLRAASQDCPPTNMSNSIHSSEGFFNFQPGGASTCLSTHSLQRIGSIQSLPDSALSQQNYLINNNNLIEYNNQINNKIIINKQQQQIDHSLAIDALVAELELDNNLNSSTDKRRSFPTIQTEINNNNSEILINNNNRPTERINLSKVDVITKIFDKQNNIKNNNKIANNNQLIFTTNGDSNWNSSHRNNQTIKEQQQQQLNQQNISSSKQKHIERGPLLKTTTNKFQIKETPPTPPPHSSKHFKQQKQQHINKDNHLNLLKEQKQELVYINNNNNINGGNKQNNNNNNEIEQQQQQRFNISNGFYDNVHQQHQGSPTIIIPSSSSSNFRNEEFIDCSSMSSRENELPPPHPSIQNNGGINNIPKTAGKRIGQLIKKLGNSVGGDKQNGGGIAAVSTLSLNRSAHEQLPSVRNGLGIKEELLTKSNSLSSERWKSQAMAQQNQNVGVEINNHDMVIDENKLNSGGGLGNRLKQTILGGMVRRRVPI